MVAIGMMDGSLGSFDMEVHSSCIGIARGIGAQPCTILSDTLGERLESLQLAF
jgi:hypothetical protein